MATPNHPAQAAEGGGGVQPVASWHKPAQRWSQVSMSLEGVSAEQLIWLCTLAAAKAAILCARQCVCCAPLHSCPYKEAAVLPDLSRL